MTMTKYMLRLTRPEISGHPRSPVLVYASAIVALECLIGPTCTRIHLW